MFIEFKDVNFTYDIVGKNPHLTLKNINLSIAKGEYLCITGPTGSGKSTLVQHINGLLKPTMGQVFFDGLELPSKGKDLQQLRRRIGFLFQFPEDQLFEETIAKDICFGPRKLGIEEQELQTKLKKVMDLVGLPYEEFKDISPMRISGGQKRRVALACTLITDPDVLILDEPTVGLDPSGKFEILELIKKLQKRGRTIIKISHNLDDIADHGTRVIIMDKGKIIKDGRPKDILTTDAKQIAQTLYKRGWNIDPQIITWDNLEDTIWAKWKEKTEKKKVKD